MAYEAEYAVAHAARDQYGDGSPEHHTALAALREAQGNPVMAEMNRLAADQGPGAMQAEVYRRLWGPR